MPFELRIALRYLTARRKQAFISVISAISMLGVVVGVMALMVSLGLMTGLQGEIRSKILGATAHLSVFRSRADALEDYRRVTAELRRMPRVLGAAPAVYGKALMSAAAPAPATIKGIDPRQEMQVTELASQVDQGSLLALAEAGGAIPPMLLGRDLAATLGVGMGDVVTVTSAKGVLSPFGMMPRPTRFRVAGTVRTGLYEFDTAWAYVSLGAAQSLFMERDRASLVEVRIDDMYDAGAMSEAIKERLGQEYTTTTWIEMNQSLFSALWLEKMAIAITIGLIVMVAALNIVATLILMVMEKHKDIAILVSMGASRADITRIFVLQGTVIGAVGTLVGAVLGWGACRVLDQFKLIRVPVDVYQIPYVPFKLLPEDALTVVLGAILICFLATIHPARGAARLDPAEALRYE